MRLVLVLLTTMLLAGCGTTFTLGYTGKGGTAGITITLPEAKPLPPTKGLSK